MKRTWTDRQLDAMNTRDKTLLVSAAAGSGKTATLTERIIRSVLDESDPINIDEMLIVTFTKAATGELKEKIAKAVKGALGNPDVDRERLEAQLHLLPSAHISTIDSFCSSILRQNCEKVGVDPGYRIIDTAEAELLGESILNGIFSSVYEGALPEVATAEELALLADCLTETRTDGDLAAIIRMLYDTTKDLTRGVANLRDLVEEYNPESFVSVENTRFGAFAMSCVMDFARHHKDVLTKCLNEHLEDGSSALAKKIQVLSSDIDFLNTLLCLSSYDEVRECVNMREHPATPNVKSAPHLRYATGLRRSLKEDTEEIRKTFLEYSTEEWRRSYTGLYSALGTLVRLCEYYHKLYMAEKMRIAALEYSDVTRFTYECLWQDGERTDTALAEAAKYRAIYVDEYQDVNELQHKIFEAISTETNRFMVGDIKQSIYGFRGAEPSIFARMKTTLPALSEASRENSASIFMSENFRCDKGIIDFVNLIFDKLFFVLRDSIGFKTDDRLVYKKVYEDGTEPPYKKPEICLLPYRVDKSGVPEDDDADGLEPLVVAQKIRELLATGTLDNGEPIRPGDIAIILRTAKGKDKEYAAALSALGIPSAITESESFFLNPDVLLLLSILHAIDNPRRDIYLAAAMCSPIFGFDGNDLVKISAIGAPSLYDNLVKYTEEHADFGRGRDFLLWLKRYRAISMGTAPDKLINRIYRETGLLALASSDGGRDELIRIYEYSRRFENSSFKGLYSFLSYINSIVDRNNAFDKREANLSPDEVKIITAHSSKGLEFPVVFFVGSEYQMKRQKDAKERMVYESRFGIGMYLRTPSGLSLVSNPTKDIILAYRLQRRIEEEARVLYVILTRAREQLYIVGKARKGYDNYLEEIETKHENLSLHTVYGMTSFTDMITFSSGLGFLRPDEFLSEMPPELEAYLAPASENAEDGACDGDGSDEFDLSLAADAPVLTDSLPDIDYGIETRTDGRLSEVLLRRFNFEYPYAHLAGLPQKMSVSRLYPEIFDPADEDAALLPDSDERITKMGKLPSFATGSDETESARRGIATHLYFQFCDLERVRDLGAAAELERLTKESYLSAEDAARVRIREVEAFARSRLFSDMLGASRIWRELRFNTRMPYSMFMTDESLREKISDEEVLVQGVIDCLIEDAEGNLHLVDYKTDRLTKEERMDPALGEKRLREAHSRQLSYYAEAVERMFGKRPVTVEVYSLHLGRCVDVKIN